MNPRATLVLSLLLNAALLATAVVLVRTRVLTRTPAPSRPHVREVTLAPRTGPARPTPAVPLPLPDAPIPAAPAPFHWRQLEAADYHVYAANLRAIGCPEKTLADILTADLEKLYERKRAAVTDGEKSGGKFWPTGGSPAERERERNQRLAALDDEQRALLRELLGVEWVRYRFDHLDEAAITEFIFGFLPGDQPERVFDVLFRAGKLSDRINQEAEHLLLPEDNERLRLLYRAMEAEATGFLGPAARQEAELRMVGFVEFIDSEFTARKLAGFELTGAEFREVVRAQMAVEHPLKKAFGWEDEELTLEQQSARVAQRDERIRAILGEARHAEFERAQDERFKAAFAITEEHKLPREAAVKVFDLTVAADEQLAQIRADAALSPDQRETQLTALRTATEQGCVAVLGAKAGADYLKRARKQP